MSEQAGPAPEWETNPVLKYTIALESTDWSLIEPLSVCKGRYEFAETLGRGQSEARFTELVIDSFDSDDGVRHFRATFFFRAFSEQFDKGTVLRYLAFAVSEQIGDQGAHYFDEIDDVYGHVRPIADEILPSSEDLKTEFIDWYQFATQTDSATLSLGDLNEAVMKLVDETD